MDSIPMVCFFVLGVITLAYLIPVHIPQVVAKTGVFDGALFPKVLAWFMVLGSGAHIVEAIRSRCKGLRGKASPGEAGAVSRSPGVLSAVRRLMPVLETILLMGLYIVFLGYLGFFVSTSAFVFILTLACGERRVIPLVLVTAAVPIAIWLFFTHILVVPLPSSTILSH